MLFDVVRAIIENCPNPDIVTFVPLIVPAASGSVTYTMLNGVGVTIGAVIVRLSPKNTVVDDNPGKGFHEAGGVGLARATVTIGEGLSSKALSNETKLVSVVARIRKVPTLCIVTVVPLILAIVISVRLGSMIE